MALSPNYGWAEPDNSSLVKNGAADIRTLGDAIDTSVWNVGFGQAGKNKIINADFGIWARGTTLNFSGAGGYVADRWKSDSGGGGVLAVTRQTFTAGQTDVPNAIYYLQADYTTSGTGTVALEQRIEDVNTFAGQTVTYSFYAKVNSGTKSVTPRFVQDFGSGGSSTVVTSLTAQTLTTSWQRFSVTSTVPSISGKTIGAGSYLRIDLDTGTSGVITFSFANVQIEYGSQATPFQTASGGSPQAELAMCQRYYYRLTSASLAWGTNYSTAVCRAAVYFPVEMRIAPTALEQSGTAGDYQISQAGGGSVTLSSVPLFSGTSQRFATLNGVVSSGLTQFLPAYIAQVASTAYLGWSAEL